MWLQIKQRLSPWWLLALALMWPALELGFLLHNVRPGLEQTAWTLCYLNDCKVNRACLASQLLATTGSIKAAAAQSYQTSRSVEATARMVQTTGRHPAALRDDVTTPAGCTIGGLLMLEDGKIRSVLARAIEEAAQIAQGLGQTKKV